MIRFLTTVLVAFFLAVSPLLSAPLAIPFPNPLQCVGIDQIRARIRHLHKGHKLWIDERHVAENSLIYAYVPFGNFGLVYVFHRKCQVSVGHVSRFFVQRLMGGKAWQRFHALPETKI